MKQTEQFWGEGESLTLKKTSKFVWMLDDFRIKHSFQPQFVPQISFPFSL